MIFKPLTDNIIAKPEKAAKQTKSGFILPAGGSNEQPRTAEVVAIGPKVTDLKVGDRFLFQAFAAAELKVGDDDYIAIREEFVIATVGEDQK